MPHFSKIGENNETYLYVHSGPPENRGVRGVLGKTHIKNKERSRSGWQVGGDFREDSGLTPVKGEKEGGRQSSLPAVQPWESLRPVKDGKMA